MRLKMVVGGASFAVITKLYRFQKSIAAFKMALMHAYKRQIALICTTEVIIAFDSTLLEFMIVILALISAIQFMFLCGTFAQTP
jgi:hypothetical protein